MNTIAIPQYTSRRRLVSCLAISLSVHAAALIYFHFHPILLESPFHSLFGITAAHPSQLESEDEDDALLQKNQLIEEVFEQIIVLSPHFQEPYDMIQLPKGIALAPDPEENIDLPQTHAPSLPFAPPHNAFAAAHAADVAQQEEAVLPTLFTAASDSHPPILSQLQIDSQELIAHLPTLSAPIAGDGAYEDVMVLSPAAATAAYESDLALNLTHQLVSPDLLKNIEALPLKTDSATLVGHLSVDDSHWDQESVRSTLFIPKLQNAMAAKRQVAVSPSMSELEVYDFPALATAAEWNDDFDVGVTFLPNPEGQGYIFSLSLTPNYDISSHSLKQNLYFIIDRSSSVQKHRFAVFKRAVLKALSSMQHGDTFNIVLLDKKIARFSPESRPVSLKNIHAAEEFLDKQEAGGLFAAADVYTSLDKILPSIPENEEMHTAILLTDGKTSMNAERKQRAIKKWVEKNKGKVSLYACAVGRENDLLSLDMLSTLSGGKLLYSDTHASFPRKLAKLVLDLKDPVAKDIVISAVPHNPNSHIEINNTGSHLLSLYSHQPYVIVGQIDEPCSFDLILQGRHRDEWIAIRKNISFVEGHKGDRGLEKQWNAQHATTYYSKFLEEGKAVYLKQAKEILKKSRTEVAFE